MSEQTIEDLKGNVGAEGGGNAPTWKPKKDGDQLAGTLSKIDMTTTDYGDSHVLTITDEEGERHALWLGTVLLKRFVKDAPGVGTLIVVTYLGTEKSKAGFTYKNYDIQIAEDGMGQFAEWMAVRERFNAQQELLEDAARQGSSLAPNSGDGLEAPF